MTTERILDLPAPPPDVRIAYGAEENQFGELRLPAGTGPHPVVVYTHGGFWRARIDVKHAGHVCAALAKAGWASWSLEYRRIGQPGGGWPGTMEDVKLGAQHLKHLTQEYKLDLAQVVAAGHSAGGQLALWLAAQKVLPLRGVTSLAGVCDLRRAWELKLSDTVVGQLMGGGPQELSRQYALASPIELLPIEVPQRLLHGTLDDIVPLEISERFATASKNAQLVTFEGAGHLELIDPRTKEWPTVLKGITEW